MKCKVRDVQPTDIITTQSCNITFGWKPGARVKADPQEVGLRIRSIEAKHGKLNQQLVLDDAKDPSSPMHDEFEWDDSLAANEYRLTQAGYILRCLIVVESTDPQLPITTPTRAVVHIADEPTDSTNRGQYVSIDHAMNNADTRQRVVERALFELNAWFRRYNTIAELADVCSAIAKHITTAA